MDVTLTGSRASESISATDAEVARGRERPLCKKNSRTQDTSKKPHS